MNFFQTGIIIFQMIVYPILTKDISANFGKSSPQERFKEPVYLMINQSNWDSPAKVNIHFADEFNYVIFYVSVYYDTDNYDFNTKAALYWTGFKKMKPDSDEMVFDSQRLIHCSAIMHTTCSIQSPWCYAKENLNDLISIEMKASSKFNSIMNATFIPAKRTSKPGRCENGMKSHNCGNNVTVCPVTFTKEFVPLIGNDSSILSSIGSDLKYPKQEKITNSQIIIPVVIILLLLLIMVVIVLILSWRKTKLGENDTSPEGGEAVPLVNLHGTLLKRKSSGIVKYKLGKTKIHRVNMQEFTIMLSGLEGHGKRTLIDALLNYLFVRDNLSLKNLLDKQGENITSYIIHSQGGVATVLNIVNVPSFTNDHDKNTPIFDKINEFQKTYDPDFLCFVWNFELKEDEKIYIENLKKIKLICPRLLILTKLHSDVKAESSAESEFIKHDIIKKGFSINVDTVFFTNPNFNHLHDYGSSIMTMKNLLTRFSEKRGSLIEKVVKLNGGSKVLNLTKLLNSPTEYRLSGGNRNLNDNQRTVSVAFLGFKAAGKRSLIKGLIDFILSRGSHETYEIKVDDCNMKIVIPAMAGSRLGFTLEILNFSSIDKDHNDGDIVTEMREYFTNLDIAFCFLVKDDQESSLLERVKILCGALGSKNNYIVNTFNSNPEFRNLLKKEFSNTHKLIQISTNPNEDRQNNESLPFIAEHLKTFLKKISKS